LATLEEKLEAIDDRFRNPSKQRDAARYIVRKNRKITSEERKAICQEIPIKKKTLQGLFTELRKMDLYPPQKTEDIPKRPLAPERPQETSHRAPDDPLPPQPEYATKEDFETLKNSINFLASVIGGEAPSNPGELASVIRGEAPSNLDETEEDIEMMYPEERYIQEGSWSRESVLLQPITQILYDSTKNRDFGDYPGTSKTDPFKDWKEKDDGKHKKLTWSDFLNILVPEFYFQLYGVSIEMTARRKL